jgi:HPt (histidine-containing phosphotransfer) domain-containing protein
MGASQNSLIRSSYADDPDMQDLVKEFVEALPQQVGEISKLLEECNLGELRRRVHQLKGAGGGYGFNDITSVAASAERNIIEGADIDQVIARVKSLQDLIRSVEGYDAQKEKA